MNGNPQYQEDTLALEEVSEELWFDIAKGLQNATTELGLT